MLLTHIAIALLVGLVIGFIAYIIEKADKAMEETQEANLARLVEGMRARREAMERGMAATPARRRTDSV